MAGSDFRRRKNVNNILIQEYNYNKNDYRINDDLILIDFFRLFLAPNFVPQILSVTPTGNTTINVKWNCTGIPPGDFAGYSVQWYNSTTNPKPKEEEVGRQPCETNLTKLEPFTDYTIRVAARTTQPGNYSKERSTKTLEGGT